MSCGGTRFACGIRRFEKHKFEPNRPSNQELHNENENRLSELLRSREEQDMTFFPPTSSEAKTAVVTTPSAASGTPTAPKRVYSPWVYREEQLGAPLHGSQ